MASSTTNSHAILQNDTSVLNGCTQAVRFVEELPQIGNVLLVLQLRGQAVEWNPPMVHIPTLNELVVVRRTHRLVEIRTIPVEGERDTLEAEMEDEQFRGQISPPTQDVNGHCRVVDGQVPRIRRARVVPDDEAVT